MTTGKPLNKGIEGDGAIYILLERSELHPYYNGYNLSFAQFMIFKKPIKKFCKMMCLVQNGLLLTHLYIVHS